MGTLHETHYVKKGRPQARALAMCHQAKLLLSLGVTASDRASGDLLMCLGVTITRMQQVGLTPPSRVQGQGHQGLVDVH